MPYSRAPHVDASPAFSPGTGHNAALLIDFDNVTMGRRSDLSKELKSLLESDIIKGKVAVQRAYADWRRYPQYIVPLSEASIDLIFAPAYGSSKKNATDIRMAIDALELVFIRPEIGTFILLTGDSDFSSLVLKLKEYGKYVIGVGIQESSSDILVQNCDEYYSYTSLTGLTKTTDAERVAFDPWVLVEKAIKRMADRRDVMRSDRLKQVMIELDPGFEEREHGFPKFSKFLAEASSRGLIELKRMENGQYEVAPGRGRRRTARRTRRSGRRNGTGAEAPEREPVSDGADEALADAEEEVDAEDPLRAAYVHLVATVEALKEEGRYPARDSDVKRRLLQSGRSFDEAELGFSKFSKFLRQADEHGVVSVSREDHGPYFVVLPKDAEESRGSRRGRSRGGSSDSGDGRSRSGSRRDRGRSRGDRSRDEPASRRSGERSEARPSEPNADAAPERPVEPEAEGPATAPDGPVADYAILPAPESGEPASTDWDHDAASSSSRAAGSLHPRTQRGRPGSEGPPPIFEGQAFGAVPTADSGPGEPSAQQSDVSLAAVMDGLPDAPESIVRYLAHRYKGVGEKTAEAVVDAFGSDVFRVLHEDPARVATVVPSARAEQLLAAWRQDFERRAASVGDGGS